MRDINTRQLAAGAERKSNKVTSISSSSTDNQYPSAKSVYVAVRSYPVYQHIIRLSGDNLYAQALILNRTPAPFTFETLKTYIEKNSLCVASGMFQSRFIIAITSGTSSSMLYFTYMENNSPITSGVDLSNLQLVYDQVTRID